MHPQEIERYFEMARAVAQRAHNPYSGFSVGCALVDRSGKVFVGCNIESSSYSATLCAERVAASSAIASGSHAWQAIFVVSPTRVSPCGVCRQFLYEFGSGLEVYLGYLDPSDEANQGVVGPITLDELLPWAKGLQESKIGRKG